MGGDGGSIPGRADLVKTKRKSEKVDRAVNLAARWKHCAISQEPLQQPIVACQLGRLYNKDKLIEYLLDRTKYESVDCSHIKTLKDVKELKLTPNQGADQNSKGDAFVDLARSAFACPITGLEMNGRFGFVYLWGCGCVFSERAMKEIKQDVCNKCQKAMAAEDVVVINGNDEEVKKMEVNMKERATTAKKNKKKRKDNSKQAAEDEVPSKLQKTDSPSTSKSYEKSDVNEKQSTSNGLHKPGTSQQSQVNHNDKKKHKTIQNDPNASSVLKSLFTTSEAAKKQPKGHWVTHNPQYY